MGGGTREDKRQAPGLLTGHQVSVCTRRPGRREAGPKGHRRSSIWLPRGHSASGSGLEREAWRGGHLHTDVFWLLSLLGISFTPRDFNSICFLTREEVKGKSGLVVIWDWGWVPLE